MGRDRGGGSRRSGLSATRPYRCGGSAHGLHVHDAEFVHWAVEPVSDQEGTQGFHVQPAACGILLAKVGRFGGGALELFEVGHEAAAPFWRCRQRLAHHGFIEHELGVGRHGSEPLALELLMHIHELVEAELVSFVHARHSGSQGGLVLRV